MSEYALEKVSKTFLGMKTFGLFAPLSYWRSDKDFGIGDLDTLSEVISFAKKTHVSIISLLPLNLPLEDNCPYAIASSYVLDPVYLGLEMLYNDFCPEAIDRLEPMRGKAAPLKVAERTQNDKVRALKYDAFKAPFEAFKVMISEETVAEFEAFLTGKSTELRIDSEGEKISAFALYCSENKWLSDHLLFFMLIDKFGTSDFRHWPREVALRSAAALKTLKDEYKDELLFEAFLQWSLTEQLKKTREAAASGDFPVDIMLDQPFAFGTADAWSDLDAFLIDPDTLSRPYSQGVPPHRLDNPQHWDFYLLDYDNPAAEKLLMQRLDFFLQFSDLLRIDHLLGFYRLYFLGEDEEWKMTLENLEISKDILAEQSAEKAISKKRDNIYASVMEAVRKHFPEDIQGFLLDKKGELKKSHTVFASRRVPEDKAQKLVDAGWYSHGVPENGEALIHLLLSPNELNDADYLAQALKTEHSSLRADDSIGIGFFKLAPADKTVSSFMEAAQAQGKTLVLESLGVLPKEIATSLQGLEASEFKPLFFGFMQFTGKDSKYWYEKVTDNCYVCFSTHDTITLKGWWEGKEKLAKRKYYFKDSSQKKDVVKWLKENRYLNRDSEISLDTMSAELLTAVMSSVADSKGGTAVFLMSNFFSSGDEGVINMPGHTGHWTVKAPVTIESLIAAAEGKETGELESSAVKLLNSLVTKQNRDSFKRQLGKLDPEFPHVIRSFPAMRENKHQLRTDSEDFLVDTVVYGKCSAVRLIFEDGEEVQMQKISTENKLPEGVQVYRVRIPADSSLGTRKFQIHLDDRIWSGKGTLLAFPEGTDLNPVSERYKMSEEDSSQAAPGAP